MGVTFPNESLEYRAARNRLLEEEIELRRRMEAVAGARRALPLGGLIPEDYLFDTIAPDGTPTKVKFSELFAPGKNTLVVYHFMFPRHPLDSRPGPKVGTTAELRLQDGPCPSCTALLDQLDGAVPHVEQRVNFVVVAKSSIDRVIAFARDRGWKHLRLLSAENNTFKRDYHGEDADGSQMPNMSVFHRESNGEIRHTWSSELLDEPTDPGQDPRHLGTLEPLWNIFDLTPEGRPKDWEEQMQYHCCL
ncbi:DUF899 family protein [Edaphobacter aggregans]|uniref:DUF899 family protein n=1 Tax=Edaphobacter aggregans TaxID=570835 RepID=UPI00054E0EDC|nr:DUF899 family protein [Edaphobacter aggregans]